MLWVILNLKTKTVMLILKERYIYMLFTGWGVRIGRNSADGGTQPEGTVSPNMDRPRPVNNINLFVFLLRFKSFRKILLQPPTYVC